MKKTQSEIRLSKQRKVNSDRYYQTAHESLLQVMKTANKRIFLAVQDSKELKKYSEPIKSSFLFGNVGTGKSVQAMWMLMECFRLKYIFGQCPRTYKFITCDELLMEIKMTFNNNSKQSEMEIIEKYQKMDVLVIDDIGAMTTTDWAYKTLYIIINHRYSNFKTTFYTSNKSLKELSELLTDDRITDRIQHDCEDRIYEFKTKSRRK